MWLRGHDGSAPDAWTFRHRTFDYMSEIVHVSDGHRFVSARAVFDPTWYGAVRAMRLGMFLPGKQPLAAPRESTEQDGDTALKAIGSVSVMGPAVYNIEDRGAVSCPNGQPGHALHFTSRENDLSASVERRRHRAQLGALLCRHVPGSRRGICRHLRFVRATLRRRQRVLAADGRRDRRNVAGFAAFTEAARRLALSFGRHELPREPAKRNLHAAEGNDSVKRVQSAIATSVAFLRERLRSGAYGLACVGSDGSPRFSDNKGHVFVASFIAEAMSGLFDEIDRTIVLVRILSEENEGNVGVLAPGPYHRDEFRVFHVDSDDTAYVIRTLRRLGVNRTPQCLVRFYREPERLFVTFDAPGPASLTTEASPRHNLLAHPEVNANVYLALRGTHLEELINYDCCGGRRTSAASGKSYFYPSPLYANAARARRAARRRGFAPAVARALSFIAGSQKRRRLVGRRRRPVRDGTRRRGDRAGHPAIRGRDTPRRRAPALDDGGGRILEHRRRAFGSFTPARATCGARTTRTVRTSRHAAPRRCGEPPASSPRSREDVRVCALAVFVLVPSTVVTCPYPAHFVHANANVTFTLNAAGKVADWT